MTKAEFTKKYNAAVKRLDEKITGDYFAEQMKLYAEKEGDTKVTTQMALYGAFREAARLNTVFLQDVLENVLEFDD